MEPNITTAACPEGMLLYAHDGADTARAGALAARLAIGLTERAEEAEACPLLLDLTAGGLALTDHRLTMTGDFTSMLPRLKPHNLSGELLVKAAKVKDVSSPLAVDATAGMGEDSLLLAAAGCRVLLFEYDPVIAALLEDALLRAGQVPELAEAVGRMQLRIGDSIQGLRGLSERPDLVYLDPMFPERQKSGLIKKKFQLLQQLERPCGDEEELLAAAMAAGPRKIIIKRPLKGPILAGAKPGYSLKGKAIRYDCLVLPRSEG